MRDRPTRAARRTRARLSAALAAAVFVVVAVFAVPTPAYANISVGDAYANGTGCTWTIGTAGIEKTLTLSSGSYTMTSFLNKLNGSRQYVQGGTASPEFSLGWDGTSLSGSSGGWSCVSGTASTPSVGGVQAVQLDVALSHSGGLKVVKHYQIFPSESVIREWVDYVNTDSVSHTLTTPSYLQQNILTGDMSAGNLTLTWMTGALCCYSDAWHEHTATVNSSYQRTFDSYDPYPYAGCGGSGCSGYGFKESSSDYIPWFSLYNSTAGDGVIAMFDYLGHWQMPIGASGSGGSLSGSVAGYSASQAAGATTTSPVATVMTYKSNQDDMTNRLLDYQYRYLWDDTRSGYFAAVRAPGDWCTGTQWCGQWDQQGVRQKIYGLADRLRATGMDEDWRDNGWWDAPGSWNGPDFDLTRSMLAKSGIKSIVYYPAYGANAGSAVYTAHPSWFASSPCGYTDYLGDLSNSGFASYMQNLLNTNAATWGDYEFRNDACPIQNTSSDKQLLQDQAYRAILQNFLTTNTGSSWFAVDSGGNEIGLDEMRLTSAHAFYDTPGVDQFYDASRLFPTDKMSGDPNVWSRNGYCDPALWTDLSMNLSFYSSAYPQQGWHGDTTDAQQQECARKLTDMYHYLTAQGVVGRWVKQYHPTSTDTGRNWFERVSGDGLRATVHRLGGSTGSSVTVYPAGLSLNPTTTYQVGFQLSGTTLNLTGAQIASSGITMPSGVAAGEVIYINLPGRPGGGGDSTAPSTPSSVTATASTDDNYPDVQVSWNASTDNTWVSYYDVSRDGSYLGRVAKGTVFLDHTPGASPYATYQIVAVDGAGNRSGTGASTPAHARDTIPLDDLVGGSVSYSGSWSHATGVVGAYDATLSSAASGTATATATVTGSAVTAYFQMGPDQGIATVTVDGVSASVDLYAPDALNYSVPLYTRAFGTVGSHTVTVARSGSKNAKSSATTVNLDGLSVQTTAPGVADDPSASYTGTWSTTCSSCDAINGTLHSSSSAGATATFTVSTDHARLVGEYCSSCGEADISVDGSPVARVDTWGDRGAGTTHAVLYDQSWTSAGTHTVMVTVRGTKNLESSGTNVYLDALLTGAATAGPPSGSAYSAAVAADSPSGYWRLADGSGSATAADSSGNGDTGTVQGTVTFGTTGAVASDPNNTAAAFDGSTGFVDLGNPGVLQTSSGTVEAWLKTTNTDTDYHAVAIKWYAFGLFVHNGRLVTYDWNTGTEHDTGVTVADGTWHQVALTFQSGVTNGTTVYLDGSAVLTTTITIQNNTHDALIGSGASYGVEYFPGSLDDVSFYPGVLSAGRIAAHRAAAGYAASVGYDAPAGYWRLGDATGSGTAADTSGGGSTGTVHGGVTFGASGAIVGDPANKAATFDGSTGFIDLGNPAAVQSTAGSVTAWIKTTSTDANYHAVAIKWYAYGLFVHNGHLVTYDWATGTEHASGVSVADGNWHHVAVTYQSGVTNGTTLYVDGTAVLTTTITFQNNTNDALIGSGSTTGVEYFAGTIDEVAFYPYPLSAGQVAAQRSADLR